MTHMTFIWAGFGGQEKGEACLLAVGAFLLTVELFYLRCRQHASNVGRKAAAASKKLKL